MTESTDAGGGRTGDDTVAVRPGTVVDAATAAHLHADAIAEGFLAALGPRFLTRLYRRIVLSDDAFLLVAESGGRRVGFIAGALDLGALYRRFLVRDGIGATLTSLGPLLRSWRLALETLRHGTGAGAGAGADSTEAAELLSVAVDPRWRGRHVGSRLVEAFLEELDGRGVGRAQVVVGADNAAAVGLYRAHGFGGDRSFELHRGTTSLLLERPAGDGR
ncbi:MAG: GNAT family N-acetyltransferase [Acidimicrobiales bacterium]